MPQFQRVKDLPPPWMPSIFKGPVPNWLTHPSRNMNELVDRTFTNAVYYPSWRVYRQQPPSALSLGHITHVFYAFALYVTSISVLKGNSCAYISNSVRQDGTIYVSGFFGFGNTVCLTQGNSIQMSMLICKLRWTVS